MSAPAPAAAECCCIALVGATASGKTSLSLRVAELLDVEVISMDSRQVYRGMDIGTAKIGAAARCAVPHHGLDLVAPDQRFSAGQFARFARDRIRDVAARGRVPLLVGGTGFFLRALTHPIFQQPELERARRVALQFWLEAHETHQLLHWLQQLDPVTAQRLESAGGRQRLLRALELPLLTGRPLSWWQQHAPPEAPALRPLTFVLDVPRERLYEAIDRRVTEMANAGLVGEVARLLADGFGSGAPGLTATGYAELLPYLRGERTLDDALDLVRRNTRAYARRQLTWFRHQLPDGAVWLDGTRSGPELAGHIAAAWRQNCQNAADCG